jgi:hypothetical protein
MNHKACLPPGLCRLHLTEPVPDAEYIQFN